MEMIVAPSVEISGCPAPDTLVDFALGKLPVPELETIGEHVASCGSCQRLLEELDGSAKDSVIERLKQCLGGPPAAEDTGYTMMEEGAAALLDQRASPAPTTPEYECDLATVPSIRQSVGSYQLLAKIGSGGMGVVYKARQTPVDRLVALKMIRGGAHADAGAVARFHQEGKAVARLHHVNVVSIFEFGEHEGLPYFSMELVEGGSLKALLGLHLLEPAVAAELVRTLAGAVAYAHERDVIHRDLKPGNILFASDGTVKISDFGLAKFLGADTDGQTRTDGIVGTPSYMAPEQAEARSEAIGRATDVYALGVILYETLTGQVPFKGKDNLQTLEKVRTEEPAPPSHLRRGIDPDLQAVCLKCLEKSPGRRYPTAQALADDLARYLAGEPTVARPPGVARRMWLGLRRHAIAASIGLLVTSGLAAMYYVDPERPRRELEGELSKNAAVTIIGKTGAPPWHRILTGADSTRTSIAPDGAWAVHSWSDCFIELLREVKHARYRVSVLVQHQDSNIGGRVGLFATCSTTPSQLGDIFAAHTLEYNDMRSPADWVPAVAKLAKFPAPPFNSAGLRARVSAAGRTWGGERSAGRPARFVPAGIQNKVYRRLELVVDAEGVTGTWDGQPVGRMTGEEMQQYAEEFYGKARAKNPDDGRLKGIHPAFNSQGGLGICIMKGAAWFKEFTVTPLGEAD